MTVRIEKPEDLDNEEREQTTWCSAEFEIRNRR
jgi:hypothetical protein